MHASTSEAPRRERGGRAAGGRGGRAESSGDGPVDAIFRAINAASGVGAALREFHIDAVTEGQDALGEVSVVVEVQGQTGSGQGVSTDIIEAAARAYVRALSVALARAQPMRTRWDCRPRRLE